MAAFKHILVPTDFGEASDAALDVAMDMASRFGSQITLLHVTLLEPAYLAYAEGLAWPTDQLEFHAGKQLDTAVTNAKLRYPNVAGMVVGGEPWERILSVAKERGVELIVMGTHGRRGLSRVFLGSVAEKVVRLSPIPVLSVSNEAERRHKETAMAESTAWAHSVR